jgi:sugar O-acyltransferase (sialic acid O-acetyltransferase NeuD family)
MDDLGVPVIVIGGGGHAKVLVSTLLLCRRSILGFADLNPAPAGLLGISCIGDDNAVMTYAPEQVRLVNGVGSTGSSARRKEIYERYRLAGYGFASVIHPSATVAAEVQIEDGVQIMAGAVVQAGSTIGSNVIVNSGAIIDHDCAIGEHAHVAPGAVLSGNVRIGAGAHIGTGACIIQGISIGAGSVVGAGAVVVKDVPPGVTVVGVPAKAIDRTVAKK